MVTQRNRNNWEQPQVHSATSMKSSGSRTSPPVPIKDIYLIRKAVTFEYRSGEERQDQLPSYTAPSDPRWEQLIRLLNDHGIAMLDFVRGVFQGSQGVAYPNGLQEKTTEIIRNGRIVKTHQYRTCQPKGVGELLALVPTYREFQQESAKHLRLAINGDFNRASTRIGSTQCISRCSMHDAIIEVLWDSTIPLSAFFRFVTAYSSLNDVSATRLSKQNTRSYQALCDDLRGVAALQFLGNVSFYETKFQRHLPVDFAQQARQIYEASVDAVQLYGYAGC